MEAVEATDQTVIIVVQYPHRGQDITMGVLVDEVVEVLDIRSGMIEPPPNFGSSAIDVDFILGLGKANRRLIFLLDICRVLSGDELDRLGEIAS
jgi:purine-binding chemotaxis protein CheW